jgi:hypothetical protein
LGFEQFYKPTLLWQIWLLWFLIFSSKGALTGVRDLTTLDKGGHHDRNPRQLC